MKKLGSTVLVLSLLAGTFGLLAQETVGFKVVIHIDNPTAAVERSKLAKMFLKKVKRWDNDVSVTPFDQVDKSPVREAFSEKVHKRSVSNIESYWQRMIFSGREVPPDKLASDEQVLAFVGSEPGGVGYVAADTELDSEVKELTVTD
jgi:ABC-type phosphate transport system substrate-binding protein